LIDIKKPIGAVSLLSRMGCPAGSQAFQSPGFLGERLDDFSGLVESPPPGSALRLSCASVGSTGETRAEGTGE
jgi:hypothetical protein